jgi:hypothetical protein
LCEESPFRRAKRPSKLYGSYMTKFVISQRRWYAVSGIFVVITVLAILALFLKSNQLDAVAAIVQAVAVIPAVIIAALALANDSRGKQVDRVLDFHREFNSEELQSACVRLIAHLREHGTNGRVRPTSRDELRHDPVLSRYANDIAHDPRSDVSLILRFFERVNAAKTARIVEPSLLVELIGRHAAWWDSAIAYVHDDIARDSLRQLSTWADGYASANQERFPYLRNWGGNTQNKSDAQDQVETRLTVVKGDEVGNEH